MEEKKYQIFISSTYKDLIEERNKVIETLLGIYHLPVGMEMFSAGNDEQWEIIKETISSSDYYILILGHRYGSVTSEGISYTEKEYDYALELNKPIISFVKNRDVATTPDERDSDSEKQKRLDEFVTKVTANKMCDFWENKDELATKVAIALPKSFRRNPQIGWIRGDQALSPKIVEELAILSKKNRELSDEVQLLREKISKRKPEFEFSINNHPDKFEYIIDESSENYFKIDVQISYDDIDEELKEYITQDDITSYINDLPSDDIIKNYEESSYYYSALINNSPISQLSFEVCNIGSMVAKEVYVTVSFPDEIVIFEKDEISDVNFPNINLPVHPTIIAKKRKKDVEDNQKRNNLASSLFSNTFDQSHLIPNLIPHQFPTIQTPSAYKTSLKDNTITLTMPKLIHTKCWEFDDKYSILVKEKGDFDIKVSIISEELEEPINILLPARVYNKSTDK